MERLMRLTVLGSSGTAPQMGNPASGYLVQAEAASLWMDAGPGTYMALLAQLDPAQLDAVLLSHMHPDHCTDLFALAHELAYVRRSSATIPVLCPDGSTDRIAGFLGGAHDHPIFETLQFREVQPGETFRFDTITVSAQAAHHSVPALAYRLDGSDGGLGYTGDTGPSELIEEHFAGVDTLLAESSLQESSDPYPFHMSARQAGEMAARAGAKSLLLTHIPASLDPAESLRQAATGYAGHLSLAGPGETYMIPHSIQSQQKDQQP
jgi:ribonuclease BN (tRNA processing enzyme)